MGALRRYFIAGLLVWVPLGITALIIEVMVNLVYGMLLHLPPALRPDTFFGVQIPALSVVVAVVAVLLIVLVTGMAVTNLFGKQLMRLGERVLEKIPFVRGIYGAVKQVTETLFSNSGQSFRKVVLVPYPHPASWSLAFLTGEGTGEIRHKTGRELINVFIPTTPNPTSGFFLMFPREDVIELDMSVDDGLKMLLSVGVVQPKARKQAATPTA
ncbi:MAG: DUF502 domain-containing protein [Gammaproteobacteria bacterium]|nr:DUF502 domain-containing protein [Gammaproteobacteria bacterium]